MERRKLGSTGLEVSEIGYGAWQLCNSDSWGGMDDQTALRLIDEAIDGGINLFDTAPTTQIRKASVFSGRPSREDVTRSCSSASLVIHQKARSYSP